MPAMPRLRDVALLPWWLIQLGTGAKSLKDNRIIGSRRLNRLGLYRTRVRLACRLAQWRRRRLARLVSADDRAAFARDGFVRVDGLLPADEFTALRHAILSGRYPAREMVQGDTITRRIAIDAAMMRAIPALKALLASPRWRGLMRYVSSFDIEPLYYIQTIMPHRHDAPPDPQTEFHADAFHPSMKAWFFLDDVAQEDGPLTYLAGSHVQSEGRLAWENATALRGASAMDHLSARGSFRISAQDQRALGYHPPQVFAVPANTLIVADTYGFHARGMAHRPSTRVEIWAYSRRNPFIPWTGFDLLSLPGIAERRIGWLWAARDRLVRWVGQPWRSVGMIRPNQESADRTARLPD